MFCFSVRPWLSAQLEKELSVARAEIVMLGAACDAATAALEREREASSDAVDEAARAARADADTRAELQQARVRERRAVNTASTPRRLLRVVVEILECHVVATATGEISRGIYRPFSSERPQQHEETCCGQLKFNSSKRNR